MRNKKTLSKGKQFSEVEYLEMLGTRTKLSPVGLWVYAKSYANAASFLDPPVKPYEPVRYYLATHSIELSFKAYLSINGLSLLELSEAKYGHNLVTLLTECEGHDLDKKILLTDAQKEEIKSADLYYSGKVFEYPASGEAVRAYPHLPDIKILIDIALFLVENLEVPCREAS